MLAWLLPPRGAARPDIVLLMADEWRFDWDGEHDTPNGRPPLELPTLRALRARGVAFESAYVPSPVCAPSRAALSAGREYDEMRCCAFNGDGDFNATEHATYYRLLADAGYWTMVAGKDDLTKPSILGHNKRAGAARERDGRYYQAELGFRDGARCGGKGNTLFRYPAPVEPYGHFLARTAVTLANGTAVSAFRAYHACLRAGQLRAAKAARARAEAALCTAETFPQELYQDTWVARRARALLARRPAARPFFLWVSFPGPHEPFVVTAPMADATASRAWPAAVARPGHRERVAACARAPGAPGVVADQRCNYAASVEHLDALMGDVLGGVDAATTIACATSDHGAMLHDHGKWSKMKPWEPALRVPLVCAGPGLARARVVRFAPVALLDLSVRRAGSRIFAVADDAEPPPPARPSSFLPLASPSSSSSQATFLDLAGVPAAAWRTVTARSLRGLLEAPDAARARGPAALNRTEVTSGLQDSSFKRFPTRARAASFSFRVAVMALGPSVYKLVCCKGACPGSLEADRAGAAQRSGPSAPALSADKEYYAALYDTLADPYDQRDLLASEPEIAERLRAALPVAHGFACPRFPAARRGAAGAAAGSSSSSGSRPLRSGLGVLESLV